MYSLHLVLHDLTISSIVDNGIFDKYCVQSRFDILSFSTIVLAVFIFCVSLLPIADRAMDVVSLFRFADGHDSGKDRNVGEKLSGGHRLGTQGFEDRRTHQGTITVSKDRLTTLFYVPGCLFIFSLIFAMILTDQVGKSSLLDWEFLEMMQNYVHSFYVIIINISFYILQRSVFQMFLLHAFNAVSIVHAFVKCTRWFFIFPFHQQFMMFNASAV